MDKEELIEKVAEIHGNNNSKYLKWRLETAREIIPIIVEAIRRDLEDYKDKGYIGIQIGEKQWQSFWERWEK